jgi:hypothetical protein
MTAETVCRVCSMKNCFLHVLLSLLVDGVVHIA